MKLVETDHIEQRITAQLRTAYSDYQSFMFRRYAATKRRTYDLGIKRGRLLALLSVASGERGYQSLEKHLKQEWDKKNAPWKAWGVNA